MTACALFIFVAHCLGNLPTDPGQAASKFSLTGQIAIGTAAAAALPAVDHRSVPPFVLPPSAFSPSFLYYASVSIAFEYSVVIDNGDGDQQG